MTGEAHVDTCRSAQYTALYNALPLQYSRSQPQRINTVTTCEMVVLWMEFDKFSSFVKPILGTFCFI